MDKKIFIHIYKSFNNMRRMFHLLLALFISLASYSQEISPVLFSQNAWMPHWFYNGSLDKIWPHAKPAKFELIRIGGIEYEDNFTNRIDDYIRFIDSIRFVCNAEPLLQVPRYYTEQQTNDLYDYVNVTRQKNVKYWSIGNEPDVHNPNTLDEIKTYFVRIARVLKDRDSTLVVAGPSYANFWVHVGDQWDSGRTLYSSFLNSLGMEMNTNQTAYLLDVFTFHNYVGYTIDPALGNQDIERVVNNVKSTLNTINNNRTQGIANKAGWAIAEFNISRDGSDRRQRWSFYAGQYFAMMYGLGMEKEAVFITPWSLIEGQYLTASDLSMFENEAHGFKPRSTFYHVKMLSDNRRGHFMKSTSTQKTVRSIGMKDETGFTIMLLNTNENISFSTTITLNFNSTPSDDLVIKADAAINAEYSTVMPENTTSVFVFDPLGNFIERTDYSKNDADNFREPQTTNQLISSVFETSSQNLLVYPTIAFRYIFFHNAKDQIPLHVKVVDISGRIVIDTMLTENKLNIGDLDKGIYLIQVKQNNDVYSAKFLKP
jgi:hypothetical protein